MSHFSFVLSIFCFFDKKRLRMKQKTENNTRKWRQRGKKSFWKWTRGHREKEKKNEIFWGVLYEEPPNWSRNTHKKKKKNNVSIAGISSRVRPYLAMSQTVAINFAWKKQESNGRGEGILNKRKSGRFWATEKKKKKPPKKIFSFCLFSPKVAFFFFCLSHLVVIHLNIEQQHALHCLVWNYLKASTHRFLNAQWADWGYISSPFLSYSRTSCAAILFHKVRAVVK